MKNQTNKWELIEKFVDLKLLKARFDWYLNKRNNEEDKMVFLDAADAVCVVALTTKGTLLLVKQFRFGVEEETLEAPGGLVDAERCS
ncbi:MAG: hypothetical protein R2769_02955 [Saprospiraceae bacterium]